MARKRSGERDKLELISVEADGRVDTGAPPWHPDELRAWLATELELHPADRALIDGHRSPFEYLVHVYFEGRYERDADGVTWRRLEEHEPRTADCIVWANRGGGKTFLGAVATLLDLLFKESVQVRILAGSLEQAGRMHAYLQALMVRARIAPWVRGHITTRSVRMESGACAQVLAASQTSVRGTRVQKIRCDEVELFPRELWEAAQLVTRSLAPSIGPWGDHVRGSVEALSTMHRSHGLMWELVKDRESAGGDASVPERPVFRWGVVDALERCDPKRACEGCPLWGECAGRAKDEARRAGHIRIDDAITLKRRVDRATWESEMLCLRPREQHAVYPEFDPARHVVHAGDARLGSRRVTGWYAGMDFGIRAESVVLLASLDDAGVLVVEREQAAKGQSVLAQRDVLRGWSDTGLAAGPDGASCGLVWVSIDPAGFSRNEQTGERNAGILKDAGWRVVAARGQVNAGIRIVRARLAPADEGRGPTLLVHARCARLIECLRRYRYAPERPESLVPEKGEFDHACDALRYLVTALDGGEGVKVSRY